MVLVKNRVNYFYYILSIKAAKCNPFCTRFIRGSYNYYTKKIKGFPPLLPTLSACAAPAKAGIQKLPGGYPRGVLLDNETVG